MRNRRKALTKAVSWRIISSVTSFSLAWLWFGDWKRATSFAAIEGVIKFAEYYTHELAWQGRMKR